MKTECIYVILSQMQFYTGTRKSITRVGGQIVFKGYD